MGVDFYDDDYEEDDDRPIVPCPHCGEEIYDDVDQCPRCRTYLSASDFRRPISGWLIIVILLVILGLLLPFVRLLI